MSAIVFLLGPGMWNNPKRPVADPAPMQVRRDIAKAFISRGHKIILMEDDPDRQGEDYIQKFDRLLRNKVTDVVLYWPPLAKMQTTYDELILLCDRRDFIEKAAIRLWALHHFVGSKDHSRGIQSPGSRESEPLPDRRRPPRSASPAMGGRGRAGRTGESPLDGIVVELPRVKARQTGPQSVTNVRTRSGE